MKPDAGRLVAIDGLTILIVSAVICVAAHQLLFMTVFVPAALIVRLSLVLREERRAGGSVRRELIFLGLCTALGAFNDWNSVVHHRIYDYTVPHYVNWSTIPVWMLLFWGMILRMFARVSRWAALDPPEAPDNRIGVGPVVLGESATAKIAIQLALVFATRQAIYRNYEDPVWSWLPFAAALALHLLLFRPSATDWKLLALCAVAGPLVEILYINVGGLHEYHLGWLGGVPLWIALWWLVVFRIWTDLSLRLWVLLTGATTLR